MKSRHERAALFGFFRNCSETLISSDVNREGYAYRAIESAKIDGAGEYTIFFKMVLPLSKPVISALGIFTAVGTWNDYTQTLYYTKSADIQTLSYYMLSITKASASAASLGETMRAGASSVLTTMSNSAANYKTYAFHDFMYPSICSAEQFCRFFHLHIRNIRGKIFPCLFFKCF